MIYLLFTRTKSNKLTVTDNSFTIPPKGIVIKRWPSFVDDIGCLVPVEFKEIPFAPKRVFIVMDVPANSERGGHAHKKTQQYLFCIKGLILVILHDGKNKYQFKLATGQGVLVDKMIWDSQKFMTGDDILQVFCSTVWQASDYIRDFEQFKKLAAK